MRTTIDLPDAVFRETKALAATRGISMKQFILEAIVQAKAAPVAEPEKKTRKLPSFHLRSRRTFSLEGVDLDDFLA